MIVRFEHIKTCIRVTKNILRDKDKLETSKTVRMIESFRRILEEKLVGMNKELEKLKLWIDSRLKYLNDNFRVVGRHIFATKNYLHEKFDVTSNSEARLLNTVRNMEEYQELLIQKFASIRKQKSELVERLRKNIINKESQVR